MYDGWNVHKYLSELFRVDPRGDDEGVSVTIVDQIAPRGSMVEGIGAGEEGKEVLVGTRYNDAL